MRLAGCGLKREKEGKSVTQTAFIPGVGVA